VKTNPTHRSITNSSTDRFPLLFSFIRIWQESRDGFAEDRTHQLALEIALGLLTCFGRRTITRCICARARQFMDWSRIYRFFSKDRWFPIILEQKLLSHIAGHLLPSQPLVVAVDDTHKVKTGRKIPSSGYFYDSKSPAFARSFKWQLRFLTICALLTPHGTLAAARGILLKFKLAPKLAKPGKRAKDHEKDNYRQISKIWSITHQMIEQIHLLRCQMDGIEDLSRRLMVIVADSTYCNKTIIKDLPDRCILISRTRRDLLLYEPAEEMTRRGRKRIYGRRLPTPDDIRRDESHMWCRCTVFASGRWHELRYKSLGDVLWKSAGKRHLRLVVIEPLSYRLRKGSKLLYRNPAYLLISDATYPVHMAIQHYFHRWEIEVCHRDLKTSLGVGQAQVRNPRSVARQFQFAALVWSWLSLASLDAYGPERADDYLPLPKWRNDKRPRPSAIDVVARLRLELLMMESGSLEEFSAAWGFAPKTSKYGQSAALWLAETVPKGLSLSLWSSILYADA
jgi:hypothetical protein